METQNNLAELILAPAPFKPQIIARTDTCRYWPVYLYRVPTAAFTRKSASSGPRAFGETNRNSPDGHARLGAFSRKQSGVQSAEAPDIAVPAHGRRVVRLYASPEIVEME